MDGAYREVASFRGCDVLLNGEANVFTFGLLGMKVGGTQPGFLPCAKFDYAPINGSIDIGFGALVFVHGLGGRRSRRRVLFYRCVFGFGLGKRAGSRFVSAGERAGGRFVCPVIGLLHGARVVSLGQGACRRRIAFFGGLFRLVLVKEAGFTGIAAEVPFIGVDGARADGIGVPADNAFIPNFPVGVVRPNVLPRRLPPFLALGGVGGLECGGVSVHGQLGGGRGLALTLFVFVSIGGPCVFGEFLQSRLVDRDIAKHFVAGFSYRE